MSKSYNFKYCVLLLLFIAFKAIESHATQNLKFKYNKEDLLYTFKNKAASLTKCIDNNLYILESQETLIVKVSKFNFETTKLSEWTIDLSHLEYEGIIDFFIEDSKFYFLCDNGTRICCFDFVQNKEVFNLQVDNPSSVLFEYTNIHVYDKCIYLVFSIDISSKSTDKRNLFIDKYDFKSNQIIPLIKRKLNANVFSITNYLNYTFNKNLLYCNDVLTGELNYYNLLDSFPCPTKLFVNEFDLSLYKTNRISVLENSFSKTNSNLLLDSLRYFFDNEITSTWISTNNGFVCTLDKHPSDSCVARIRAMDIANNQKYSVILSDSNSNCIQQKVYLNYQYFDGKTFIQVYNYFDPKTSQSSLRYKVFASD